MDVKKILFSAATVALLLTGCATEPTAATTETHPSTEVIVSTEAPAIMTDKTIPETAGAEETSVTPETEDAASEETIPDTQAEETTAPAEVPSLPRSIEPGPSESKPTEPPPTQSKPTEARTEPPTEAASQPPQESPADPMPTEQPSPTSEPTEPPPAPSETVAELPTPPTTEPPTERPTEPTTEPPTEPPRSYDLTALIAYANSYAKSTYGFVPDSSLNLGNASYYPGFYGAVSSEQELYAAAISQIQYAYACFQALGYDLEGLHCNFHAEFEAETGMYYLTFLYG